MTEIGRTTKRNSRIWNDQITPRRADEGRQVVSYVVEGKDIHGKTMQALACKPMGDLKRALDFMEARKANSAVRELVLWELTDADRVIRRWFRLEALIKLNQRAMIHEILTTDNPPYEIS